MKNFKIPGTKLLSAAVLYKEMNKSKGVSIYKDIETKGYYKKFYSSA